MSVKPLGTRVLVKPIEAETTTTGGIIIPDTSKDKPTKGTVAAVGQGTKDEPMMVSVNDTVIYGKYSGTEIEHEGEKFLVINQSELLAVIN